MTENPLELPEEEQIKYLDGLKGYRNKVIEFDFLLGIKREGDFSGFVECIETIYQQTDYAGFHATDPNWYEEGGYQTGILEPGLLDCIDTLCRAYKKLTDEQVLESKCYFTAEPRGYQRFIVLVPTRRADLVIPFKGGLFDDWGQFMLIYIVESADPFELNTDSNLIEQIKNRAIQVGKKELTDDEQKLEWEEWGKTRKDRDEAIDRYFEEESTHYAAKENEKN